MKKIISTMRVGNKIYEYILTRKKKGVVHIVCKDAHVDQDFLDEDVTNFLIDLPNLIIAEREHKKKQSEVVRFRISPTDKTRIEKKAMQQGYTTVSDYLRHLALG